MIGGKSLDNSISASEGDLNGPNRSKKKEEIKKISGGSARLYSERKFH